MIIILLGIAASLATEVVTYINKKLSGTVLKDRGAFLLSFILALVGAMVSTYFKLSPRFTSWTDLAAYFAQVWTVAQVFFYLVVQALHLDVQPTVVGTTANTIDQPLG